MIFYPTFIPRVRMIQMQILSLHGNKKNKAFIQKIHLYFKCWDLQFLFRNVQKEAEKNQAEKIYTICV